MKNTIKLDNPVQINGKSYDELTYDISEITAQAFAEADARKLSASGSKNGNAAGAAELDYGLHLYLGFAAIIAINPEIDISDLERVRGYDVMKIMRIGRDFISGKSEEPYTPDSSDAQSETSLRAEGDGFVGLVVLFGGVGVGGDVAAVDADVRVDVDAFV